MLQYKNYHSVRIPELCLHGQAEETFQVICPKSSNLVRYGFTFLLRTEYERQQKAKTYYGQRYHQIFADENGRLGEKGRPVWLVNTRENGTFIQPRSLQHTSHVIHSELNMPAFDFHSLRHTHATMLLESGANPLDVQERLGHTKLFMTWRYAHDTDAMREKTRGILDTLYSPNF